MFALVCWWGLWTRHVPFPLLASCCIGPRLRNNCVQRNWKNRRRYIGMGIGVVLEGWGERLVAMGRFCCKLHNVCAFHWLLRSCQARRMTHLLRSTFERCLDERNEVLWEFCCVDWGEWVFGHCIILHRQNCSIYLWIESTASVQLVDLLLNLGNPSSIRLTSLTIESLLRSPRECHSRWRS